MISVVVMRGKELEDLRKPSGPRSQCQFVSVKELGAPQSPGFLSLYPDCTDRAEVADAFDSVSDNESDRSWVSRRLSILEWVGLVKCGVGASGMVALRSVG